MNCNEQGWFYGIDLIFSFFNFEASSKLYAAGVPYGDEEDAVIRFQAWN